MKSFKAYVSILKEVKNRPTKFFLYLVLIIVGLFMQAYMHNYNIVYLMMFFLVGVTGAASLYGVYNLYYVKASLLSQDRFFANATSSYALSIINPSESSVYDINVLLEDTKQVKHIASIKANDTATISLHSLFAQRGEAELPKLELNSLFPLPHEIKYKRITINESILVYAQPKGVSLFDFYSIDDSRNGEISEFDGIKDFIQGENISSIHWASLAKSDSLKSKNFLYEENKKTLHFDFATLDGNVEEKLSQLTLWVLECEKNQLDFTLEINSLTLDSKETSIDEILQTITKY